MTSAAFSEQVLEFYKWEAGFIDRIQAQKLPEDRGRLIRRRHTNAYSSKVYICWYCQSDLLQHFRSFTFRTTPFSLPHRHVLVFQDTEDWRRSGVIGICFQHVSFYVVIPHASLLHLVAGRIEQAFLSCCAFVLSALWLCQISDARRIRIESPKYPQSPFAQVATYSPAKCPLFTM